MAIVHKYDDAVVNNKVRLNDDQLEGMPGFPNGAWYVEPQHSTILVDDPDGDTVFEPWHTWTVDETDCTPPRIFAGWVTDVRESRGGKYKSGPGRIIELDIVDINEAASLEVIRLPPMVQRPFEIDYNRITDLLGSHAMQGTPVVDAGRLNTTDNPQNLNEANFDGQFPAEVMNSAASSAGKNVYLYWEQTGEQIAIHYDAFGVGPAASISVSNITEEADGDTIFEPSLDATMESDPGEMATGVYLKWLLSTTYNRNPTLIDELSPSIFSPVNFLRDVFMDHDRIGKPATASGFVADQLAERDHPKKSLRFRLQVPANRVNHAMAGDVIQATFSHITGYQTEAPAYIVRRSVRPADGRRDLYDIEFECTDTGTSRGPGAGQPSPNPRVTTCDVANIDLVQSEKGQLTHVAGLDYDGDTAWSSPPTAGNLLVCAVMMFANQTHAVNDLVGYTKVPCEEDFIGTGGAGGKIEVWYKIADGTETVPEIRGSSISITDIDKNQYYMFEWAGVDQYDDCATWNTDLAGTNTIGGNFTPAADSVALMMVFGELNSSLNGPITPAAGLTEYVEEGNLSDGLNPVRWIGYRVEDDTTGSYAMSGTMPSTPPTIAVAVSFLCSGAGAIPGVKTPIRNEHVADGDGTTTVFTTEFPYQEGTLEVFVDGVPVINGLTESDPETGEFTLDFAPHGASGDIRAEIVTANYQTRAG